MTSLIDMIRKEKAAQKQKNPNEMMHAIISNPGLSAKTKDKKPDVKIYCKRALFALDTTARMIPYMSEVKSQLGSSIDVLAEAGLDIGFITVGGDRYLNKRVKMKEFTGDRKDLSMYLKEIPCSGNMSSLDVSKMIYEELMKADYSIPTGVFVIMKDLNLVEKVNMKPNDTHDSFTKKAEKIEKGYNQNNVLGYVTVNTGSMGRIWYSPQTKDLSDKSIKYKCGGPLFVDCASNPQNTAHMTNIAHLSAWVKIICGFGEGAWQDHYNHFQEYFAKNGCPKT